jgi:hypothetical protein
LNLLEIDQEMAGADSLGRWGKCGDWSFLCEVLSSRMKSKSKLGTPVRAVLRRRTSVKSF